MPITEQQASETIDAIFQRLEELYAAKDVSGLSELYHPHAVIIYVGQSCSYGREEIQKAYEQWTSVIPRLTFHPESTFFTQEGEFITQCGYMLFEGDQRKWRYCITIRKNDDGTYCIYHDEFGL
ncbi:hypothetical protein AAVH_10410 [Aphelenchoides avenae]|nr:hypothetical protein AAVH_10410 [Aphelenchus avenae]